MLNTIIFAACPLDHFIIGCNQDGVIGTYDDNKLFADCSQKYRNSGNSEFKNWYYPLNTSFYTQFKYRIGEPGFEMYQSDNSSATYTYSPTNSLIGEPNSNYQIVVECVSISPGLRAVHKDYPTATIDQAGQIFDYSNIHNLRNNSHVHLSFQAENDTSLKWITWKLHDTLNDGQEYLSSEPFTIVFNTSPVSGDLYVDDIVDSNDLFYLINYWLENQGNSSNDFYERADSNKDGNVDLKDLAALATNWLIN